MEEKAIREQLDEVKNALKKNEEEHDVLLSLLRGYEGWLRLHGSNGVTQLILVEPKTTASTPKGAVSFRGAVIAVLKEARGEPLHSKEILRRAQARGAKTGAKQPEAITDLMCYSLMKEYPLVKTAPRTWSWIEVKID